MLRELELELETDEAELELVFCPSPTRDVISDFPRYRRSVGSLPPPERAKIEKLARLVLASFRRGCQPITEIVLLGHADRDVRRGRDFENRISQQRALAIRRALTQSLNQLSRSYGLRPGAPPVASINWLQRGAGARRLVVPSPATEAQRARNRRVEIWLNAKPPGFDPNDPRYVRWLQSCLNQVVNARLAVTGVMGPPTRAALRSFQQRQRLAPTGFATPETVAGLIRVCGALPPPPPSTPTFGQLCVAAAGGGFFTQNVTGLTPGPFYVTAGLDNALGVALAEATDQTVITGNRIRGNSFEVYRRGEQTTPLPTARVVEFNQQTDVAALVLTGPGPAYFPSNPATPTPRWVQIPRVTDFFALPAADRDAHRNLWIAALVRAGTGLTRDQLKALSMPTLRLLMANSAAGAVPLTPYSNGVIANGVTMPILRYPITEPECYLAVIAHAEALLEGINAWDRDAGISIGPIQVNVSRGGLFRILWALWVADRHLFNQEFGGPLGWSMEQEADHFDLLISAAPQPITLHGREADSQRNATYFQSGTPGGQGFDVDFRRRTADRFRNVPVWPHVQEMVIKTSVWFLQPGLNTIHGAGIPPLDPVNPDRDTFILKAMLLSGYVKFPVCLSRLLTGLQQWPTTAGKLASWRTALAAAAAPCPTLATRLTQQQAAAGRVHDSILRIARATPAPAPQPALELTHEWEDAAYETALESEW